MMKDEAKGDWNIFPLVTISEKIFQSAKSLNSNVART